MSLIDPPSTSRTFWRPPRIVVVFIILFWIAQFSLLTLQQLSMQPQPLFMLLPRALVASVAVGFSFVITGLQMRAQHLLPQQRIALALLIAVVATPCHTLANYLIFCALVGGANSSWAGWIDWIHPMIQWLWSYAALSGMVYALLANSEVREREARINQLERVANDAQMRALRYQLNPHFMFNTLNSVAALIASGQGGHAEAMVENLSDFLRVGLSLDPLADLPLSREIELQSLYLAIQQVRFADRLIVRTEIDSAAYDVLVPALVTQPLIENAIRHTVEATSDPTEITIAAHVEGDELHFSITNNVSAGAPSRRGTGVGLANVEERLRLRFGAGARVAFGLQESGRYRASFVIPATRLRLT